MPRDRPARVCKDELPHFDRSPKPADHKALFEWVEATERVNPGAVKSHEHTDEHGVHHRFRYLNAAPLNDTHFELEVNFLQYWETRPNGKKQRFSWVTTARRWWSMTHRSRSER